MAKGIEDTFIATDKVKQTFIHKFSIINFNAVQYPVAMVKIHFQWHSIHFTIMENQMEVPL